MRGNILYVAGLAAMFGFSGNDYLSVDKLTRDSSTSSNNITFKKSKNNLVKNIKAKK